MSQAVLRQYWHPVAWADELGDKPFGARLLDERVVVYRTGDQVVAFKDLCAHRGTPLSMGRIDDGKLVCAYHAWAYAPDGACVRIPSLGPGQSIPLKARATVYRAAIRYGVIWVSLDEPRAPIPECSEIEDPAFYTMPAKFDIWDTGAGRMVENFADFSHFAWVHPGINGTPDDPVAPSYQLERHGNELRYAVSLPGEFGAGTWERVEHRYRIVPPFSIQLTRIMSGGRRYVLSLFVQPVSSKKIRRFLLISRNYNFDESYDDQVRKYLEIVTAQDRAIIESQRPEELPIDLSEEFHLRGPDAASIEYRRLLAEMGVSEP